MSDVEPVADGHHPGRAFGGSREGLRSGGRVEPEEERCRALPVPPRLRRLVEQQADQLEPVVKARGSDKIIVSASCSC